jgi:hypothetical protein
MKNILKAPLICAAAWYAFSLYSSALSITIGPADSTTRILGTIVPGVPANEANDVRMINYLLTQTSDASGTTDGHNFSGLLTVTDNPDDTGPEVYTLRTSELGNIVPGPAPLATLPGFATGMVGDIFTLTSPYTWLHGKWGPDAMVFYIGDLPIGTEITVNTSGAGFNGNGLSNFNLYAPGSHNVPDGGTAVVSLGIALLSLGALRKLLGSKV